MTTTDKFNLEAARARAERSERIAQSPIPYSVGTLREELADDAIALRAACVAIEAKNKELTAMDGRWHTAVEVLNEYRERAWKAEDALAALNRTPAVKENPDNAKS